ncbi:vesicular glutamate transporter 1-like [Drosophila innubila]|uniref:vesicular glutamate transporter 1-like n=1 Tax=Drosophila innubila TaxID=198719 RepID=UPI00148C4781|nr:vesicular glutamate transporter 1-like [Drosophila innubila]
MEKFEILPGNNERPADGNSFASLEDIERPPLRKIDKICKTSCMRKRYTIASMAFVGFLIAFGMRCNMQVAKNTFTQDGTIFMNWTVSMESHVDSAFFWGYLAAQIPGGFIAFKFPANKVFGLSIVSSASLNLLLPLIMTLLHGHVLIWLRVLQGLVEGVLNSACLGIWRFWAPPMERTRLATLSFSGSYAGVFLGLPLSGLLANAFGYRAPFYVYGFLGIIWYFFWIWLSFEKPRKHPAISTAELNFIENSLEESSTSRIRERSIDATIPWIKICSSMPFYAIIVANFCRQWNFYLLVLYQSSFLRHRFSFKLDETGLANALPFLILLAIVPLGGMLADLLRKKSILSPTNVRKLFSCCAFVLEGLCFLRLAHSSTVNEVMIALLCGVAFNGLAVSGYYVNYLDIAPRYASLLMGLSNGIGILTGFIVPLVMDALIQENPTGCWTTIFTLAACVHLIGCIFYGVFASGELQPWAEPTAELNNDCTRTKL